MVVANSTAEMICSPVEIRNFKSDLYLKDTDSAQNENEMRNLFNLFN